MAFSHLSTKQIPQRERLIFALDVESRDRALHYVDLLGDEVVFYKLGLELFATGHYFELVHELVDRGKRVFVDLKFFDVPETVGRAVGRLQDHHVDFVTVHGNEEMIRAASAACAAAGDRGPKVLAVTALTSLDDKDIADLGFEGVNVEELVLSRARRALAAGCAGVVSSGLEAPRLREELGDQFLVVIPGIRPVENRTVPDGESGDNRPDDQKRIVTVIEAFHNGADYIVVGRPIRDAPDPRTRASEIQQTVADLFASTAVGLKP